MQYEVDFLEDKINEKYILHDKRHYQIVFLKKLISSLNSTKATHLINSSNSKMRKLTKRQFSNSQMTVCCGRICPEVQRTIIKSHD